LWQEGFKRKVNE